MAGIYIHIPFCKSRCKYCDFFSTTHLQKQAQYVEAVLAEWQMRQHQLSEPIHTIYIGGGTPSMLDDSSLQMIIEAIRRESSLNSTAISEPLQGDEAMLQEITMEANPGDITLERAQAWRKMGINRLSIGVQSMDDELLQLIGRRHTAEQARKAVAAAQAAGFDNISIDLMYALPGQTMAEWQADIAQALALQVPHISSYGLIYEEGTPLTKCLEQGKIIAIDEEEEMQMYDHLVEQLTQHGYEHYEVSNFALPGQYSQHNSSYWNDTPYLGLGAGAHSYDGNMRWWNIADVDTYISQAMSHQLRPEQEVISAEERHMEQVMLGLRTSKGVGCGAVNMDKAQAYIAEGYLRLSGEQVVATTQGYHILNRIIEDLL